MADVGGKAPTEQLRSGGLLYLMLVSRYMSFSHIIEQAIADALASLKLSAPASLDVSHPADASHGDYASNVAMQLARQVKQNPLQLAGLIADALRTKKDLAKVVDRIEVARPGFINFHISTAALLDENKTILKQGKKYGSAGKKQKEKVLVEYSQMNVAKPMHVGHLRTMFIGDSLKRIYQFMGFKTVSDTHYGDWGTQFGMVLYAYKHWGDEQKVKEDPVNELVRLYIDMDKKIEADPELREAAKAEFKKLEDGDKENLKLCKWFVDASVKVFEGMYKTLDILPFDYNLGESYYEALMKKDVQGLMASGIATKEGEMVYVDLEPHKLGRCIFVKSDGASTYHLRDLSTYRHRIKKLKAQRNLYVVDSRQSHHFRQLFKVVEMLGWPGLEGSKHVSYGFVTLPEGSLSTRKGRIVQAIDVISQGLEQAKNVIAEKNPELVDKEGVALEVTRAAIKFANLLPNRDSDIVFEWDKVLRFDGDTGPYLQYAYARIASILRKAGVKAKTLKFKPVLADLREQEIALLRFIYRFGEVLELSLQQNAPHYIAEYLLQLAHRFNAFYEVCPIALEKDEALRNQRLALAAATAQVLHNGLYLLGINTVEEM